jgi:hypothetical protein
MRLLKYFIVVALLAAIPATLICSVALDNDNQGEFADTLTGEWTANLFSLFAIYWGFFAVFVMPPVLGVYLSRRPDS